MAQDVVIGNEVFKRRNPVGVWIGLPIITLGVYYFVWYYKINNEARRYLRDPSIKPAVSLLAILIGWIIIVPPFISIYRTGERVRRMQGNAQISDRCEPWIALLLAFVFSLHILYLQIQLNTLWDAYLRSGMAPPAAPPPLPPPPTAPPAIPPPVS